MSLADKDALLEAAVRSTLDDNPGLVRLQLAGKAATAALIEQVLVRVPGETPGRVLRTLRTELLIRYPDPA